MGGRTRETFNKRQKERARQEKQRDKIAKRQQRRSERPDGPVSTDDQIDWNANQQEDDSVGNET
jgi:hypothetical protein